MDSGTLWISPSSTWWTSPKTPSSYRSSTAEHQWSASLRTQTDGPPQMASSSSSSSSFSVSSLCAASAHPLSRQLTGRPLLWMHTPPPTLSTHTPHQTHSSSTTLTHSLSAYLSKSKKWAHRIPQRAIPSPLTAATHSHTPHPPLSAHTRLPKLYTSDIIYPTYPLHHTKKSARSDKASQSSFCDANEFSQPDFLDFPGPRWGSNLRIRFLLKKRK